MRHAATGESIPPESRHATRPLVGMDKDEITAEAARIGTYPISIIPDQDCCTLFTPKHPVTRVRLADIERAEQALPIEEMVATAVAAAISEQFRFPTPVLESRPSIF